MSKTTGLFYRELFQIHGVRSVFFGEDFITITKKDEDTDWGLMRPDIFSTIANYIESGKPVVSSDESTPHFEDTGTTFRSVRVLAFSQLPCGHKYEPFSDY